MKRSCSSHVRLIPAAEDASMNTDRRTDDLLDLTRVLMLVQGAIILATFAFDTALAVGLAHSAMPLVAVISQFVLPVSVVGLLRRVARASTASTSNEIPMEVAA